MAIFAVVSENERIIERYLRDILPLLDYDASENPVSYTHLTLPTIYSV